MLSDKPEPDLEFEHWASDRLKVLVDPPLWKALQKAKRAFLRGKAVMIRRSVEGAHVHIEIGISTRPRKKK